MRLTYLLTTVLSYLFLRLLPLKKREVAAQSFFSITLSILSTKVEVVKKLQRSRKASPSVPVATAYSILLEDGLSAFPISVLHRRVRGVQEIYM